MRSSLDDLSQIATSTVPVSAVIALPETDSTNAVGVQAAHDGVPDFTIVLTDRQRKGRGRHERVWESPEGSSLTFSVVLRPTSAPSTWGHLPLLVGLAIADGLRAYVRTVTQIDDDQIGLKWPNDVLIDEKKVSGVLLETALNDPSHGGDQGGYGAVIAGIGINVDWRGIERPAAFADRATSLAEWLQCDVHPADVFHHVLDTLYTYWTRLGHDPDACIDQVRNRCLTLGRSVSALGAQPVQGTAIGLTTEGHLVIMPDTVNSNDNMPVVVRAADVEHLR